MTAKINLGPVLFHWPPEDLRDFYFRIADEAPVDGVCLGEVVCSKRAPFFEPYFGEVAERLERAGKEVVVSTLALVIDDREMATVRAAVASAWPVEANDVSCVALMRGRPHMIGPFVNVYNEGALRYLVDNGAVRVSLPAELPAGSLAVLAGATGTELEVQVFGRLPLALSVRCYHARCHNLPKTSCQYVCAEDPDGMDVFSVDGEPFLAVNGTQTMSYTYCNLLGELAEMQEMGIQGFRLWPHRVDMVAVAAVYRGVLDGRTDAGGATARLAELMHGTAFSNGFYHAKEGVAFVGAIGE